MIIPTNFFSRVLTDEATFFALEKCQLACDNIWQSTAGKFIPENDNTSFYGEALSVPKRLFNRIVFNTFFQIAIPSIMAGANQIKTSHEIASVFLSVEAIPYVVPVLVGVTVSVGVFIITMTAYKSLHSRAYCKL